MKALVCEMCGSHDILKKDGYYVCQCCETKYTPEEARKLIVEGTVKIDNSERLTNLFTAARNAREVGDYAQAKTYYTEILSLEPNSWEAAYYSVYCSVAECRIFQIESSAYSLRGCLRTIFTMINSYADDRKSAIIEVATASIVMAESLHDAALNHLNDSANKNPTSYNLFSEWIGEYIDRAYAVACLLDTVANLVETTSDKLSVTARTKAVVYLSGFYDILDANSEFRQKTVHSMKYLEDKLKKHNPAYTSPEPNYLIYAKPICVLLRKTGKKINEPTNSGQSGCYIATAVYGTYDCPQVWTLRRFRDYTLAESWYGRAFIRTYYTISPTLVKWFGHTVWFKQMWKGQLDRMVAKLNSYGVKDTPYEDRAW